MTSLSHEIGKQVPMEQVVESFTFHFARVFECATEAVDMTQPKAASR
jgi:hypothetical protein